MKTNTSIEKKNSQSYKMVSKANMHIIIRLHTFKSVIFSFLEDKNSRVFKTL